MLRTALSNAKALLVSLPLPLPANSPRRLLDGDAVRAKQAQQVVDETHYRMPRRWPRRTQPSWSSTTLALIFPPCGMCDSSSIGDANTATTP